MTVNIEDFKKSQHILDYVDDDFAAANSLGRIPCSNDIVRLNCFLVAVCAEGCIQLDINYQTYQLQAGDLLLGLPNTLTSHTMLSPKYKIRLAGFSTRFLQRVIKMEKKTWNTATHIYNDPVEPISGDRGDPAFRLYRDLIVAKINDEPHYHHREVMQYLFSTLFCKILGQPHEEIDAPNKGDSPKEGIRQVDCTLRKFVELLSKDKGMHHSVSYYTDALCYTPEHFSKVVKQACGRTPLDLINGATIEHIKYRLGRSGKPVREVAEELNPPNQSFFGKYVKMHLGASPVSYRNREDRRDRESLERLPGSVR